MAKGRIMLQLSVSQRLVEGVTFVPQIDAIVFDTLDGDVSTIREIAYQKLAFFDIRKANSLARSTLDLAFTQVYLVSARGETPLTVFYGPSVVPSPPVAGPEMVILRVFDGGFTASSPVELFIDRIIQAHTYVDENMAGLPSLPAPDSGGIGP